MSRILLPIHNYCRITLPIQRCTAPVAHYTNFDAYYAGTESRKRVSLFRNEPRYFFWLIGICLLTSTDCGDMLRAGWSEMGADHGVKDHGVNGSGAERHSVHAMAVGEYALCRPFFVLLRWQSWRPSV